MSIGKHFISLINYLTGKRVDSQTPDETLVTNSQTNTDRTATKRLSPLEKLTATAAECGIEIVYKQDQSDGTVTLKAPSSKNLSNAAETVQREMLIYPKEIIRSSQLKRIVFGSKLEHNKSAVAGLCLADKGTFYLAVNSYFETAQSRRTFHHEFFHCIDYHDDIYRYFDPAWAAMNQEGFEYLKDKFKANRAGTINRLGFISNYAMSEVHEDKAELFSHLIVHYRSVMAQAKTDTVLQKKCQYMKNLLQKFSPKFDEYFWNERSRNSETLVSEVDDESTAVIVTLQIWGEHIQGGEHEMWFIGQVKNNQIRPHAFYCRQDLVDYLNRLGITNFSELRLLRIGPRFKVTARVPRSVLDDLGL